MSNGDYNDKHQKSFEEAMKKIINTKIDPAILIEELDKEYCIDNSSGKKVQFAEITIPNNHVEDYLLYGIVTKIDFSENDKLAFIPFAKFDPVKREEIRHNGYFENPDTIMVPKDFKLSVKLIRRPNKTTGFEVASLTYRVLDI